MVKRIAVNARFRGGPQTGVQRVAAELLQRIDLPLREVAPAAAATGLRGHAWEQAMLPLRLDGAPLWSPCNTGPLAVRAQIVTMHDAATFDHPEWFSRGFALTYRLLWPALARRVRRIVTVSDYSRGRLADVLDIPASAIEVVPNGIAPAFSPRPGDEVARATAPLGVEPGRYFATLSTIEPRKNLALVLAAWERLRGRLPADIKLLLIGGAGSERVFRADGMPGIDPPGIVRSGFVADAALPALLSGAIGLAYPSRYEGFGLPPLEAMACGTPAIVAPVTSLPEVCGSAALYVDPDDAEALAAHMLALAAEPRLRADLAEAGRVQAQRFAWDAAASRMRDILIRDLAL